MSSGALTLAPEDAARAQLYRLMAGFLATPPDAESLAAAAQLGGDASEFGRAVTSFADACATADPRALVQEYHDLFIGVGRGELLPFASYYLTGFLHEKPLAKLRGDMGRLGMARSDGVREPEDHIAAVCEMMAGLITGEFGPMASLDIQKHFFEAHLSPWAGHFFSDLEAATSSALYARLGGVGRQFMAIEETAFSLT